MAVGDLITQDWQMEFGGLLIGAGTSYDITALDGLAALPAMRSGDVARTLSNGQWAGVDLLDGRTVTIEMNVVSSTDAAQASALDAIITAAGPTESEQQIAFRLPGYGTRLFSARLRRSDVKVDWNYMFRYPKVTLELFATDPLIYSQSVASTAFSYPTTSGGLSFAATPPFSLGTTTGGSYSVTNSGTYPSYPVLSITGSGTSPRVTNTTTGQYIQLNTVLAVGDNVLIDHSSHSIYLNGVRRYDILDISSSTFWQVQPGLNSISFTNSNAASTGTLTVITRSAWA